MSTGAAGRILVVDDDRDWCVIIGKILTGFGHRVTAVATGEAALAALEKDRFDIVFLDISLPDLSGMDLIPRIRAMRPEIMIDVFTGQGARYRAVDALNLGADRYIEKEADINSLRDTVERTLERQWLVRALNAQRTRYEQLIGNAPIGVFTIDPKAGTLTYVNRHLLELTGYTEANLIGHPPHEFVLEEDRDRMTMRLTDRISGESVSGGEGTFYTLYKADGTQFRGQIETHAVELPEGAVIEGTLRDATAEARLTRLRQTVIQLGQWILSTRDIDHILQSVLDGITEHSGFQRAVVALYDLSAADPQAGDVYKMLASGLSDEELAALRHVDAMSPDEREVAFSERFRLGDAFYIPHDQTPWDGEIGLEGRVSIDGWDPDDFLFIPLRGETGIIGHISVDDPIDCSAPTVETLEPVVALANLAALAVERTYRFSQLDKQKRRLHGLTQFSRELARAQDVQEMCDLAARRLQRDMSYEFFGIWIHDADDLVLNAFAAQEGYVKVGALYPGLRMPVEGVGFTRWVLDKQEDIIVPDVSGDERYLEWSDRTQSEIDVPIVARKGALGVISVESSRKGAFGDQDREIITALASQLSVAVTNLTRQRLMSQVRSLGHMLTEASTVDELTESTLTFLTEQFAMQHSAILLVDGEDLVLRGIRRPSTDGILAIGERFSPGKGIVAWVAAHNRYALVGDVASDHRYVEGFAGIRSELAVPVSIGDRVLGVLNIESPRETYFDDEDRRLLEAVAAQFAIALSNLEAQDQLRRQAVRDSLTNLFNRHYFNEVVKAELERADRYEHPMSLLMLDVDGFRRVNNTLGHLRGDDVLRQVARILEASVRASDSVIRYGGDEFLILMPETSDEEPELVARRLKMSISRLAEEMELGESLIGLSIGIYMRNPHDKLSVEEILEQADKRMYADKRATNCKQADEYRY